MQNYLVDNKAGIILDAEGTRANRKDEIAITETMLDRVRRRFDLLPQRLAGDTVMAWPGCESVRTLMREFSPGQGEN